MTSPIPLPLDWLRGLSDAWLPDDAQIMRPTRTNTPSGVVDSWTAVGTAPCRVSHVGRVGAERLVAETELAAISRWTIWLPAATDVKATDRIVVTSADGPAARTFDATLVVARSYEAVRAVICQEVG